MRNLFYLIKSIPFIQTAFNYYFDIKNREKEVDSLSLENGKDMVMKILIIFFMLLGCLISHVVSGG